MCFFWLEKYLPLLRRGFEDMARRQNTTSKNGMILDVHLL